MKDTIIEYIESGLNVLPTRDDKRPQISSWKHLQENTITNDELIHFNNAHGVAVICGKISGNLEILDFDNHQNTATQNITDYLNIEEVKQIKEKYNLCIEKSGGGGYHIFYRCEKIGGNAKLANVPMFNEKLNKWRPDAIIETRGEGGYVIVAPTPKYAVIRGNLSLIETITVEERTILIDNAKTFNKWNNSKATEFESNEKPGEVYNKDFNSIAEAKDLLQLDGWSNVGGKNWRRPGKNKGVSATFGMVADNVFYNFTANGYPFDQQKAYTPFQILALLKFGGDFKATAKELVQRYDLSHKPKQNNATKEEIIKPEQKETNKSILEDIFNNKKIDFKRKYIAPTPYLSIAKTFSDFSEPDFIRLFTPSNISVITGKAKSKKTFFQSMIASALNNGNYNNRFLAQLPENRKNIITFDTEQSIYDVAKVANRIKFLSNGNTVNLHNFSLRGMDSKTIIDFMNYVLYEKIKGVSVIFIDQIADLTKSVNDEAEAVEVGKMLERVTADLDIHACCMVHQNKLNDFAQGWLGTQLMKKAETVIKVTKDKIDNSISYVEPDLLRGEEFEPFGFRINNKGIPELLDNSEIEEFNTNPPF